MQDEVSFEARGDKNLTETMDGVARTGSVSAWDPGGPGNVYFLSLGDPANPDRDLQLVKVGITKNDVELRIAQLQTGNPYQIRCEASFLSPVPRQVEHWVHRTNASRVAQLEWLRVARPEIPDLVSASRQEEKRLAAIAAAKARWNQSRSNKKERQASTEERRLHEEMQDVRARLLPIELQVRQTRASIALLAGQVFRIPGVLRIDVIPPSRQFNSRMAFAKFPGLAARYTVEKVEGQFYWRGLPRLDSPEWSELRVEVEALEEQKGELDHALLENPTKLRDAGERTDDLVRLHGIYLNLTQEKARLDLDEDALKARMIQQTEDFEAITDVCSFPRSSRPALNHKSFCEAHVSEAAACCSERGAYVRRTIYPSRSY